MKLFDQIKKWFKNKNNQNKFRKLAIKLGVEFLEKLGDKNKDGKVYIAVSNECFIKISKFKDEKLNDKFDYDFRKF